MLIVHQLSDHHDALMRRGLPEGVTLERVSRDAPWVLPEATEALIVGMRMLRKLPQDGRRPQGWPPALRWMHLLSTGVDMLPRWMLDMELLTVSRGAQSTAIAEYILAAMLTFEKEIPEIFIASPKEWALRPLGVLSGKSLGVIGLGNIGRAVAKRALAFDMTVRASRRSDGPSGIDGVELASVEELCETSDHLVICAPLTEATRGILGPAEFAAMKKGVHLVNISRGEMIDHDSLARALDDGTLARATLDVWDEEPVPEGHWIYGHPGVRLSPHISFMGRTTNETTEAILTRNVALWAKGDIAAMHGRVNREAGY